MKTDKNTTATASAMPENERKAYDKAKRQIAKSIQDNQHLIVIQHQSQAKSIAKTASAPETRELRLTDYYVRHYTDNGQITAYAQWNDGARTEGKPDSAHMMYLRLRADKEGVQIRSEKW